MDAIAPTQRQCDEGCLLDSQAVVHNVGEDSATLDRRNVQPKGQRSIACADGNSEVPKTDEHTGSLHTTLRAAAAGASSRSSTEVDMQYLIGSKHRYRCVQLRHPLWPLPGKAE